ncbi:hypothetical protein Tdes44962_MAKER07098 [Teratosphaeria destructans]|uniref:Uncharacterized protein n=1 Tax=Teratosphaeria destructans TaxID=418781 RepID=A0A9W7T022_9PEZI|nr:hypothetical protein Tdes44962_MAKER07098 [Teratosphaeria destructans]
MPGQNSKADSLRLEMLAQFMPERPLVTAVVNEESVDESRVVTRLRDLAWAKAYSVAKQAGLAAADSLV